MRVSELVKQLFHIMTKVGDIEVVGEANVLDNKVILESPEQQDASSIISRQILDELSDDNHQPVTL